MWWRWEESEKDGAEAETLQHANGGQEEVKGGGVEGSALSCCITLPEAQLHGYAQH